MKYYDTRFVSADSLDTNPDLEEAEKDKKENDDAIQKQENDNKQDDVILEQTGNQIENNKEKYSPGLVVLAVIFILILAIGIGYVQFYIVKQVLISLNVPSAGLWSFLLLFILPGYIKTLT